MAGDLSFSRVRQQRESGDARSHGSDAFDEGSALWGRRPGVPVFVMLVRYLLHEDPLCLVFDLLQRGLLEGQPDRRVVGILEIGPLDHHYYCDTPLHVDPGLSAVEAAVAEGSG